MSNEIINTFKEEYDFLSNFYPCKVRIDGIVYPSAEHAYQAQKTDNEKIKKIFTYLKTPNEAKILGNAIKLKSNWEFDRPTRMIEILKAKFIGNEELTKKLLATENRDLVEGNYWHDNYWGECYCVQCTHIKGINLLGRLLVHIRIYINTKNVYPYNIVQ